MDSGVYKSYYMLQQPVAQMRDFITDALRSSIPVYTLDEVFAKKDDIAKDVNATVSEQMDAYGFTLVSTLITKIALPAEVEDSMNQINAAQRTKAAAQDLAEADRIRRVTEAKAEAEAMEKAGEGIANQRKAIALGIKDSLETIQETGVGNDEANQLFMLHPVDRDDERVRQERQGRNGGAAHGLPRLHQHVRANHHGRPGRRGHQGPRRGPSRVVPRPVRLA